MDDQWSTSKGVCGKFVSTKKKRVLGNLTSYKKGSLGEAVHHLPTCTGDAQPASTRDLDSTWRDGRRIVELDVLADALTCSRCTCDLLMRNIIKETRQGLGSVLHVLCTGCTKISTVPTGKRHSASLTEGGKRCFDVNTKLAAAMLNAGIGESQLNNILAELNLPPVSQMTIKEREREIGSSFETVAEASCNKAISEENNTMNQLSVCDGTNTKAEVSIDGGWQKRGTGRIRNSRSGHVTVIGKYGRKCLSFGVAKKDCRKCTAASRRKSAPHPHKCRKNWSGSSKAMEPFLSVQCLQKLKGKGFNVNRIIMDDDTTTISRARQCFDPELEKCSDNNHVIKNFSGELISVKSKHTLSQKSINKITKDFSYAIKQNSADKTAMKETLMTIIPHAFGDHENCDTKWCRFEKMQEHYSHTALPHGKDLTGENKKSDLQNILKTYTSDCMLDKLSNLQTSNPNENMNHMIARKAPKAQHFSGSESLDYRVSGAIAQKNEGNIYMTKVNEEAGLSPGKFSKLRFDTLDRKREQRKLSQNTVQTKRRRLELKSERLEQTVYNESLEGVTYETAVDRFPGNSNEDIVPIPDPLLEPHVIRTNTESAPLVFFDVETTGLAADDELLQIAAKEKTSGATFNSHIFPSRKRISNKVKGITGLEIHGKVMYQNLEPVQAVSLEESLELFSKWLHGHTCRPCILIAHNAAFDARMLVSSCRRANSTSVLNSIIGFVDTIPLFKEAFPGKTSYKQESLVKDLLPRKYTAHDALEDVSALHDLFLCLPETSSRMSEQVQTVETVEYNLSRLRNEKQNLSSFDEVVISKLVSKTQIKRIAGAGLSYTHLKIVCKRSGETGLRSILKPILHPFSYKKTCDMLLSFLERK